MSKYDYDSDEVEELIEDEDLDSEGDLDLDEEIDFDERGYRSYRQADFEDDIEED